MFCVITCAIAPFFPFGWHVKLSVILVFHLLQIKRQFCVCLVKLCISSSTFVSLLYNFFGICILFVLLQQSSGHSWLGSQGSSSGLVVKKTIKVDIPVDQYPTVSFMMFTSYIMQYYIPYMSDNVVPVSVFQISFVCLSVCLLDSLGQN